MEDKYRILKDIVRKNLDLYVTFDHSREQFVSR